MCVVTTYFEPIPAAPFSFGLRGIGCVCTDEWATRQTGADVHSFLLIITVATALEGQGHSKIYKTLYIFLNGAVVYRVKDTWNSTKHSLIFLFTIIALVCRVKETWTYIRSALIFLFTITSLAYGVVCIVPF